MPRKEDVRGPGKALETTNRGRRLAYVKKLVYMTKPCGHCQKPMKGTERQLNAMTYCCIACYQAAVYLPASTCEQCGTSFNRKLGGFNRKHGLVNRFCSMECRKAMGADNRQAAKEEKAGLSLMRKLAKMLHSFPLKEEAPTVYQCAECAMAFTRTKGQSKKVCRPCMDMRADQRRQEYKKTESYKASRKAHKTKRRAKENATIHKVKPMDVFERDKWTCMLCGIKTPKRLRGTYKDNAPELDHIITLAEGGDHTYANLQCACRKCNIDKGSTSRGQLGLPLH